MAGSLAGKLERILVGGGLQFPVPEPEIKSTRIITSFGREDSGRNPFDEGGSPRAEWLVISGG